MRWQTYVLVMLSILAILFVYSGQDVVRTVFFIVYSFLAMPTLISVPLLGLFVILTIFAYLDFKKK